jgi:hypothetical protein
VDCPPSLPCPVLHGWKIHKMEVLATVCVRVKQVVAAHDLCVLCVAAECYVCCVWYVAAEQCVCGNWYVAAKQCVCDMCLPNNVCVCRMCLPNNVHACVSYVPAKQCACVSYVPAKQCVYVVCFCQTMCVWCVAAKQCHVCVYAPRWRPHPQPRGPAHRQEHPRPGPSVHSHPGRSYV